MRRRRIQRRDVEKGMLRVGYAKVWQVLVLRSGEDHRVVVMDVFGDVFEGYEQVSVRRCVSLVEALVDGEKLGKMYGCEVVKVGRGEDVALSDIGFDVRDLVEVSIDVARGFLKDVLTMIESVVVLRNHGVFMEGDDGFLVYDGGGPLGVVSEWVEFKTRGFSEPVIDQKIDVEDNVKQNMLGEILESEDDGEIVFPHPDWFGDGNDYGIERCDSGPGWYKWLRNEDNELVWSYEGLHLKINIEDMDSSAVILPLKDGREAVIKFLNATQGSGKYEEITRKRK